VAGRLLEKGRLPLEEILETRELAVGDTMIDIGANIGTTAIPRVVLGDFRTVYAVEPDETNYACLVHNVIANGLEGLVLPDRVALGDRTGDLTLRRARSGTHHPVVTPSAVAEEERMVVPCLTLDDWVVRRAVDLHRVTFIKSDTQGWDVKVLAGASGVLAHRHIAWQIEFSPAMLGRAGSTTTEAFSLMAAHFSRFIDLRGDTGVRARPTSELAEALARVGDGDRRYTNLLLYNTATA
jgi:FkbM family methyltransferase